MSRLSCVWFVAVAFTFVAGCSRQEYDGPKRYPLTGSVTMDGEPVDVGSISFLPQSGTESMRVSGGPVTDGKYEVPEPQGANAGTYRIEIRWQKKTGKKIKVPQSEEQEDERREGIPPKFNTESQLTVEVKEGQEAYDFHLKSKG